MSTPELEPVRFDPEHQARINAANRRKAETEVAGAVDLLADITATSRRIGAATGTSTDASVYGDHCTNCQERWCLPADKASCAHKPICEDCWPNGCDDCEREVEEGLRRREAATARILSAALELRTGADDLSETDLGLLDWRARKDILRHVRLAIDAFRRVETILTRNEAGR